MKNTTFDSLKFVALVLLPGAGAAYFGLAEIWSLPYAGEVVGTVTVVDTFLGLIIKWLGTRYKASGDGDDGEMVIDDSDPLVDRYSLNVGIPIEQIAAKDKLVLNVRRSSGAKNSPDVEAELNDI